jgi:hypothetical protein
MSERYEVISAFMDDEPFDAGELADALSDATGRALLIDLIALRHVTQPEDSSTPARSNRKAWPDSVRGLLAIAAMIVAVVGGYLVGVRQSQPSVPTAPAPTRVVQTQTPWQVVVPGRMP